jgi:hypothetical protein
MNELVVDLLTGHLADWPSEICSHDCSLCARSSYSTLLSDVWQAAQLLLSGGSLRPCSSFFRSVQYVGLRGEIAANRLGHIPMKVKGRPP